MEERNNEDENRPCFICGESIDDGGVPLVKQNSDSKSVPIPSQLVKLIGNEFLLMVSRKDKVCSKCLFLVNKMQQLEKELKSVQSRVIAHLQERYDFEIKNELSDYKGTDDQWCVIEEVEDVGEKDEVACEICGNLMDRTELKNHIETKHGEADEVCFPSLHSESTKGAKGLLDSKSDLDLMVEDSTCDMQDGDLFSVGMDDDAVSKYCSYCDISFSTIDEKNRHEINTHEEFLNIKVEVEECSPDLDDDVLKVVKLNNKNNENLEDPLGDISDNSNYNTIFKCAYCGFTSENKKIVENHTEEHELGHVYTCEICEMPFPTQALLSRHIKVHERLKKAVNCKVCSLECHDGLHLQYHTRNCHDVLKRSSCVICKKKFNSSKELKRHVLSFHSGAKNFKCDECGLCFLRHVQFENHKVYVHGNKLCKVCGKRIEDAEKLRQHEKRHARTDIIKFDCEVCGKNFKTPGGLRVHKVSHTGNYKFFCEFCGKGFMSAFIMEEHKGVHTKEERYVCDLCGRKFVLHSTFHLHKQWHKDPLPFPCKHCGKKFKYRSERANHNRKEHTGELPHQCTYCSARFLKSALLKKHLITHTKEYPFLCKVCGMGFEEKRAYARHLAKVHKDTSLINAAPKKCEYKVTLRPDEYQEVLKNDQYT